MFFNLGMLFFLGGLQLGKDAFSVPKGISSLAELCGASLMLSLGIWVMYATGAIAIAHLAAK